MDGHKDIALQHIIQYNVFLPIVNPLFQDHKVDFLLLHII